MESLPIDNCPYSFGKTLERRSSISSIATEDSGYSSIFRIVNSIRVYSSKDEYLVAMIEDLAIWLQSNHSISINIDNFFDILETGVILCKQAGMVQTAGDYFLVNRNNSNRCLPGKWSNCYLRLPNRCPTFKSREIMQTFLSRDNIANFIGWLREFGFSDSIMFETEDLISRKNIRHVVLALLELARVGGLFGLNVPNLIELEQEIDAEISIESETVKEESQTESYVDASCQTCDKTVYKIPRKKRNSISDNQSAKPIDNYLTNGPSHLKHTIQPKPYFPECNIKSLDEMVREILLECECASIFPMTRLAEGKYLFGEKDLLIFVRILRNHVMVRVGGGWDTLNHLLYKNDPCRKDKPQGTLQVPSANKRESKPAFSTPDKNNKSIRTKIMQSAQKTDMEELSARLSNIPTSYSQKSYSSGKSLPGKVKRRSSLQLPRRPDLTITPKIIGSKIPILCYKNLKSIKELPLTRFTSNFEDITETTSAPCSRHQSPPLKKHSFKQT